MTFDSAILHRSLAWVALACALAAARPARAGFGALDLAFGTSGKVVTNVPGGTGTARDVVVQPDGKIIVVGEVNLSTGNTSYDFGVVRLAADGSLDPTFGVGGGVATDFGFNFQEFANAVALQDDGKFLVVGRSFDRFAIARYNANGSLDTDFATNGKARTDVAPGQDEAHAVLVQADGKIVVAGDSNGFGLARYNANGTLDTTFAGDGTTSIRFSQNGTDRGAALAIQDSGKYVVAGTICPGGQPCRFGLERFNVDGTLDTSFGSGGLAVAQPSGSDDRATAIRIQPDGKLLVAGRAGSAGFGIARFTADGTLDPSFGGDGSVTTLFGVDHYDSAEGIALQPDGSIMTAGYSYSSGFTSSAFALARHDSTGSPDLTFGGGGKLVTGFSGSAAAYSLAFYGSDKILLAGGDANSFALARYLLTQNTLPGPTSVTQPVDETTGTAPATVTLSDVTEGGDTTLETSTGGPPPPEGFQLGKPPTYYEITTTVSFTSAQVCIHYTGVRYHLESSLRLLHFDGVKWVNVTTSVDRDANIICGVVTSLSPFTIVEDACDVLGDIEPDDFGDCGVDLADVALARRKTRGDVAPAARDGLLGDVFPGVMACAAPRSERRWCASGDDEFTLDDVHVIHALSIGVQLGCDECSSGEAVDRRLPGDLMPTGAADGVVDAADVSRARDILLELAAASEEMRLRADVAPFARGDGLTVVTGDGAISVADVVLLMRAAHQDDVLAWPARQVGVATVSETSFEAWSVNVGEWPAWAPVVSVVAAACPTDDLLSDVTDDGWSVGCVPDSGDETATADLAVATYRAPERVPLVSLTVGVQVIDSSLATQDVALVISDR